jgi:hypothetical protein
MQLLHKLRTTLLDESMSKMVGAALINIINQISIAEFSKVNPRVSMMQAANPLGMNSLAAAVGPVSMANQMYNPMLNTYMGSNSSYSGITHSSSGHRRQISSSSASMLPSGSESDESSYESESEDSKSTLSKSESLGSRNTATDSKSGMSTQKSATTASSESDEEKPLGALTASSRSDASSRGSGENVPLGARIPRQPLVQLQQPTQPQFHPAIQMRPTSMLPPKRNTAGVKFAQRPLSFLDRSSSPSTSQGSKSDPSSFQLPQIPALAQQISLQTHLDTVTLPMRPPARKKVAKKQNEDDSSQGSVSDESDD